MGSGSAPSKKQSARQQQAATEKAQAEASAVLAAATDSDSIQEALALTQNTIFESVSADLTAQVAELQEGLDQRLEAGLNRLQAALVAEIGRHTAAQLQTSPAAPAAPAEAIAGISANQVAVENPIPGDSQTAPEAPAAIPAPQAPDNATAITGVGEAAPQAPLTADNPAALLAGVVGPGAAAAENLETAEQFVFDFSNVDWLPPLLFSKRIGEGFDVLPHVSSSGEPAFYPIDTDLTYKAIVEGHKGSSVPLHKNEALLEYLVDYCAGYYLACSCEALTTALQDGATRYEAVDGHVVMRRDTFNYIAMAAKTATKATSLIRDRIAHIRARKTKTIDNDTVDILAQALYAQPISHLGSDRFSTLHRDYLAEFDKQIILQGAKRRAGGKKRTGKPKADEEQKSSKS